MPLKQTKKTLYHWKKQSIRISCPMNTVLDDFGVYIRNSYSSFMMASKGLFYYVGVTAHCPSGMNKSTLGCYFIKLTLQSSMSNINKYQTMLRSLKFNVIFYCDQSWRDNVKKMELFCGRQPIGKMVAWRCLSWINV